MWADLLLMWLWTPHLHKQMESAERMKKSTEKNAGEGKTARLGEKGRGISLVIQLSSLFNKLRGKEEGRVSRALQESRKFFCFHIDKNSRQKYNLQEWSNKTFLKLYKYILYLLSPDTGFLTMLLKYAAPLSSTLSPPHVLAAFKCLEIYCSKSI